jgi:hypothetical protein
VVVRTVAVLFFSGGGQLVRRAVGVIVRREML